MTKISEREDKTIGGVTWHVGEPDGGPDVGISVYLGENDRLYCGEISRVLFNNCGGREHFDSDGGWFIVRFCAETKIIAKCGDRDNAQEFLELIAAAFRSRNEG